MGVISDVCRHAGGLQQPSVMAGYSVASTPNQPSTPIPSQPATPLTHVLAGTPGLPSPSLSLTATGMYIH